ncbi:uncharacterized protein LOC131955715 [Physella acuta]|uniref:uncharacterized protein LOC131955715 n=1 Tax=Physella acuta TaxID=109671 RepID=UPI0027DB6A54|nr:uncharacterized protein LOC131955715 [Physella acuta]XP_059175927.1 uncharacterized protein LOC131955715 [Physella acuta]
MTTRCKVSEPCLSDTALGFIVLGTVLVLLSFFWPADPNYTLDMSVSAQQNEQQALAHQRLMTTLYSIAVVGMALVLIGACIVSGLLTHILLAKECQGKKTQAAPVAQQVTYDLDVPMNSRSVSWGGAGNQPVHAYYSSNRELEQNLVRSDELEMNRYFSSVKPYGTLGN